MEELFLKVLNLSFSGSIAILYIIFMRFFLKGVPKIFSYILWIIPCFRLICPFSFESILSIFPTKVYPIPEDIVYMQIPKIDTGINIINNSINSILPMAEPQASINPLQIWQFAGTCIWICGIIVMFLYNIISILKLKKILKSCKINDGICITEVINTPFVMGLFNPVIYIPLGISNDEKDYIIFHEKVHIKRCDYIFKLFFYIILCIHWFNPIVWGGYFIMEKDMEMSCDEAVISKMGDSIKKDYSISLLKYSAKDNIKSSIPFSSSIIKERIKNILKFKKTKTTTNFIVMFLIAFFSIGLILNPITDTYAENSGAFDNKEALKNDYSNNNFNIFYDENTNKIVVKKNENIKKYEDIIQLDYYIDKKYIFTVPGQCIEKNYNVDNEFIDYIDVINVDGNTQLIVNEKKVTAFSVEEDKNYFYFTPKKPSDVYKHIAIIDAGHGGEDPGIQISKNITIYPSIEEKIQVSNICEKDLNYFIARLVKSDNIKIYYTRIDDSTLKIENRVRFANEIGGVFVSIHQNTSYDENKKGTTAFYYKNDESKRLAEVLNKNIAESIKTHNNGISSEPYFVIRETEMPAVSIEAAYMSNAEDLEIIQRKDYFENVAKAIVDGLEEYWNNI